MYPHRKFALFALWLALLPFLLGAQPYAPRPVRILFLHHSCGHNLIEQGGVREGLTALGYEFYDHGYNGDGLRLADGTYTGTNFDVPDDNTDPDGLALIFSQPLHDPPDNTFSYLMQYDVIAFKSCFSASSIGSDEQLAAYKANYLTIRDRVDRYPDKIFVIVTQPPQVPANSNPEEAARARALALWLRSDDFLAGHPNLFVFDFFDLLAGEDNFLRPEYRSDEYDAHPNERANREIGPQFVAFLDEVIRSTYGEGSPPPVEGDIPPEAPSGPATEAEPIPGVVDDFEATGGGWETNAESGSSITCAPSDDEAHGGASALHLQYTLAPGGWADCGRAFDAPQEWSAGEGLSLFVHHRGTATAMTVMLFSGDPDHPTPFEATVALPTTAGWQPLTLAWEAFEKAEWADEGGLTALDPARMTGYGFSLEGGETGGEGSVWIDDVRLLTGGTGATGAGGAPTEASEPQTGEATGGPSLPSRGGLCASAFLPPLLFLLAWLRRPGR